MDSHEINSEILVKLKALAYHYGEKELTLENLGKAILSFPETTKILSRKLKVHPYSIQKIEPPEFEIPSDLKDIPWPTNICERTSSWFDSNDDDNIEEDINKTFKKLFSNDNNNEENYLDIDSEEAEYEELHNLPIEENDFHADTAQDEEELVAELEENSEEQAPAYGNKSEDKDEEFNIDNPEDLITRLVEILPKMFWYKKRYFDNPQEVIETINLTFEEVVEQYSYYEKQLMLLRDSILNQILDGQFSDNQIIPLPIVICSFEDNNINPILKHIAEKIHYKFTFLEETLSLSDCFNFKTMYPFTMNVIRFNDKKTDLTLEFHKLLAYYETGIFQNSFEYEGSDEDEVLSAFINLANNVGEYDNVPKDFFFRNHIIIFLLQIDSNIDVDSSLTNAQIKKTILSYYKDCYHNDQHESIYSIFNKYVALFKTIKSENLILFDYGDTVKVLLKVKDFIYEFLEKYPDTKKWLSETSIKQIIYLNILKVGSFDFNSLKLSITHTIYKINQLLLGHEVGHEPLDIYFDTSLKVLNDFFKLVTQDEISQKNIHFIEDNFIKHSQKLTYRINFDETKNKLIFNNVKLETIIKEGSNLIERPKIRFSDVIGCDEAKNRFKKIIDYYRDQSFFLEKGLKMSNRILLIGPPGTGKTMVAKAFAGEIGLPFYAISAAEVTSQQWAGWGASLLRKIFYKAKKNKPAVVFLDEIDAFGKRGQFNGEDGGVGYDAKSIMNTLLVLLDGVEDNNDVIVIGATNRPEDLDDALLRSKRFGLKFEIKPLTSAQRIELIKIHLKKQNVEGDYDTLVSYIKDRTYGDFPAAKIVELIEETQLYSIIDKNSKVTIAHFDHMIDKFILGEKISNLNDDYKKNVAIHEAGHAVIHQILFPKNTIHSLSVGLRKSSVGITLFKKDNNENGYEEMKNTDIVNHIVISLAGMQAEKIKYGHWDLGSSEDFVVATHLSLQLCCNLDLGSGIKPAIDYSLMVLELGGKEISPETKKILHELLETCSKIAYDLLSENWEFVENLADQLESKEDLNWDDISPILKDLKTNNKPLIESLNGVKISL